MNTQQEKQRICGSKTYHSVNCHNRIRITDHNKFETITLCGKHAFNYSVVVENKHTHEIKETVFPNRKAATAFFVLSVKKYNK